MCSFLFKMKKIFVTALCSASVLLGLALYAGQSVKPEMKALYDANVEALSAVEQISETVFDIGEGRVMTLNKINKEKGDILLNTCVAGDGVCLLTNYADANNNISFYKYLNCKFMEWKQTSKQTTLEFLMKCLEIYTAAL